MGQNPILAGGVESRISIYQSTPNEEHPAGTRGFLPDGRVFYWCRNESGSSLAAGKLHMAASVVAVHVNHAALAGSGGIGQQFVTFTMNGTTGFTVNQYKDGYLYINAGTGLGQTFKIRDHLAYAINATGVIVNLFDPLVVALDVTSKLSFRKNIYDNPQAVGSLVGPAAGVPAVALATATRGWLQTWGPCAVLSDVSAPTTGSVIIQSVATAGAIAIAVGGAGATVVTTPHVGAAFDAGVSAEYRMIDLRIRQ